MILIRPATSEDVSWVAERLRAEDAEEIRTASQKDPVEIVHRAFSLSRETYAVYLGRDRLSKHPAALFGVSGEGQRGAVWFLATDDIKGFGLTILLEAPYWLNHLSRHYPDGLHNYADLRNTLHIRWCQLTGFTLGNTVDLRGFPFVHIHRPSGGQAHV